MAFEKLANWFGMSSDPMSDENAAIPEEPTITTATDRKNNVLSMNPEASRHGIIRVLEPRGYADAKDIAKDLLNDRAVLINLKKVNENQMCRITDFLTGTVYAINGDLVRVDQNIFLYTPANFEIDSTTSNFSE